MFHSKMHSITPTPKGIDLLTCSYASALRFGLPSKRVIRPLILRYFFSLPGFGSLFRLHAIHVPNFVIVVPSEKGIFHLNVL